MNLISRKLPIAFLTVAVILFFSACAGMRGDSGIKVTLNGIQEVPPVDTSASGSGKIYVAADKSVSGSVTTSGVASVAAPPRCGRNQRPGRYRIG